MGMFWEIEIKHPFLNKFYNICCSNTIENAAQYLFKIPHRSWN